VLINMAGMHVHTAPHSLGHCHTLCCTQEFLTRESMDDLVALLTKAKVCVWRVACMLRWGGGGRVGCCSCPTVQRLRHNLCQICCLSGFL
jgi:hypothetical protein